MAKGIEALDAAITAANAWPWWEREEDELAFRRERYSQFTGPSIVESWTGVCGYCGAAVWKHRWSDGSCTVESHASRMMGSDVPCGPSF